MSHTNDPGTAQEGAGGRQTGQEDANGHWEPQPATGAADGRVAVLAPDCPACARVAADDAEPCCVCGSGDVAYRNYRDMPFCQACANCGCGQTPCVRTAGHPFVNAAHCDACRAWWLQQIDRD
ncbi:hypothetical protein OG539_32685 [Actinacidiphila glaucinigra]|uniref:hypothetical protein n=1 Tax=Actinacidiphila glaucinigra TaxID=235986 RepID=UPI00324863AF